MVTSTFFLLNLYSIVIVNIGEGEYYIMYL